MWLWASDVQDGNNFDYGQRFAANGALDLVSSDVLHCLVNQPQIAALANGGFVVVWQSIGQTAAFMEHWPTF